MAGTYADLYTRILDELNRATDATALAQVKLEILSAIAHYERQRFWFNEGLATNLTTTAGQTTANNFPTDLLEFDGLEITYAGHPYPLTRRTYEWYVRYSARDTTVGRSFPTTYIFYNNTILLYPVPDQTYSFADLSYLKQLTALSGASDTNEWMISGEELIRARAKAAWRVNYAEEASAMADMMQMAGSPYYSTREKIAHASLVGTAVGRMSTGRLTPTSF